MHPLFEKASGLTETIIAGSIEVHRDKGAGLKRTATSRAGVCQPEIRADRIQRLHAGRASAVRFAGGGLRVGRSQGRRKSAANPQGAIVELHEIAERPHRIAHQFS